MSWDRADAATYLASTLSTWLTQAGLGNEDDLGQLKEPIDDALLLMGTGEDDLETATISDTFGFRKVLRYTALLRIWDAFGDRVSAISIGGPASVSKSFDLKRFDDMIRAAKEAADPFITATTSNVYVMTSINYDYLEPMVTT
jgi:glucose-6-phosphate isomerase